MSPFHPSHRRDPCFALCLCALALLSSAAAARFAAAQGGYPPPTDRYVNDFAGIVSPGDARSIALHFAQLGRSQGVEAVVVTIDSVSDYATGERTIESFATNLFNAWGIGDAAADDGVLIVLAVRDRAVRIELGAGYGRRYDEAMREVIDGAMVPYFRNGLLSQGLVAGAERVAEILSGPPAGPTTLVEQPPRPVESPTAVTDRPTPLARALRGLYDLRPPPTSLLLASLFLLLTGGVVGLRYLRRIRTRRCPSCRSAMVRLDDLAEDPHLDPGQQREEVLASVDYDVWQCPRCERTRIEAYRSWFSGAEACPECGYRTLETTRQTLVTATRYSEGQESVVRDCHHCDHRYETVEILPRETTSEDSSRGSGLFGSSSSGGGGSSFGGGRSSGGGASGRW